MSDRRRPRRALLFMPGDEMRKIEKGAGLAVDGIIMDLEDGVALTQKAVARQTILTALQTLDFGASEKWVRINPISTDWWEADLAETFLGHPDGYLIPKAESAEQVATVDAWLQAAEARADWPVGAIHLCVLIESALGVVNLKDIAAASSRLVALMFGAEDLAGSIGAVRTPPMDEVAYARSAVSIVASAYGLQALDTPFVDIHHLELLATEAQTARRWGYDGKSAIHPKHIPIIKAAFTSKPEDVEQARALIQAYEAHQREGRGAFAFEGKMVDAPIIQAARDVVARAPQPSDD